MIDPFQHIVVGYDGSSQARMALDRAIDMALSGPSRLSVVTVYEPPMVWEAGPMIGPVISPEPSGEAEKEAMHHLLQQAVQLAKMRGVSDVRGELLQGHPADAILSFTEQEGVDLVVMGSRGYSATARLLLGSVSDAVVHHAHVAVLVVRPPIPK
jgi:nucleotide-binding universal stress UspA family protein